VPPRAVHFVRLLFAAITDVDLLRFQVFAACLVCCCVIALGACACVLFLPLMHAHSFVIAWQSTQQEHEGSQSLRLQLAGNSLPFSHSL
jgi:hypothetical protein